MPRSRFALAITLCWALLAATAAFAQQDPEALYDGAIQQFRADAFAEAVRLFEQFRSVAPENDKADDALYYIGRALAGLGQPEEAADRFEQVRIAREDIAYVVAHRLLAKTDEQLRDKALVSG